MPTKEWIHVHGRSNKGDEFHADVELVRRRDVGYYSYPFVVAICAVAIALASTMPLIRWIDVGVAFANVALGFYRVYSDWPHVQVGRPQPQPRIRFVP